MPDVEEDKLLLLEIENRNLDSIKRPISPRSVPILLLEHITDGCGGKNFKPWMHEFLKPICRNHDWRYQQGYREWDRIKADFLLFFEGLLFCIYTLVESLLVFKFKRFFKSIASLLMLPLYLCTLLLTGWYTFSRFKYNGEKMTGFQSLDVMEIRADLRKEEFNPKASYNERRR